MAYTEKEIDIIFLNICERIENGESLRSVLRSDNMPSSQTFYIWIQGNDLKSKQYAYACEKRADAVFEEIIEIADNSGNDKIDLGDGIEGVNHEAIQRDRLRVDARKWAVSKMNPKKYGDKLGLEHSGEVKTNAQPDLSKLSEKTLKQVEKELGKNGNS